MTADNVTERPDPSGTGPRPEETAQRATGTPFGWTHADQRALNHSPILNPIERLLAEWQPRLGLAEWEIEIMDGEPRGGAEASMWVSSHYSSAMLWVNSSWESWPAQKLRRTIIHELIHLLMRDVNNVMDDLVKEQVHRDVYVVLKQSYKHAEEGFTEKLARILANIQGD